MHQHDLQKHKQTPHSLHHTPHRTMEKQNRNETPTTSYVPAYNGFVLVTPHYCLHCREIYDI